MRKIIIAGNWKMHKGILEATEFASGLKRALPDLNLDFQRIEIVICPAFTALYSVGEVIFHAEIKLGAQDVFWEDKGAFTGEVSAVLLKDVGVSYVIVGHSERRQYFFETNQTVNKKVKALLKHNLTPIICVGETLEQRENNLTFSVLEEQIRGIFDGISSEDLVKCTVAYEPVWAIGTGKNATPFQAEEAQKYIRDLLSTLYDKDSAQRVSILYGGSVKPENISELIKEPDIDGALIGGASLILEQFLEIILKVKAIKK